MQKTKKNNKKQQKTRKIRKLTHSQKCTKEHIIKTFMEMLNVIKLYHWNTTSYPKHKATDELYTRLNDRVDKFVEVILGKKGDRVVKWKKQFETPNYNKSDDFKNRIYEYRQFLIHLDDCFHSTRDSDLFNIRDEILADINQFLYLLTLK